MISYSNIVILLLRCYALRTNLKFFITSYVPVSVLRNKLVPRKLACNKHTHFVFDDGTVWLETDSNVLLNSRLMIYLMAGPVCTMYTAARGLPRHRAPSTEHRAHHATACPRPCLLPTNSFSDKQLQHQAAGCRQLTAIYLLKRSCTEINNWNKQTLARGYSQCRCHWLPLAKIQDVFCDHWCCSSLQQFAGFTDPVGR